MNQDKRIQLRVSESEKTEWEKSAKDLGKSLTEWIRERCNETEISPLPPRLNGPSQEDAVPAKKSKAGTCVHGIEKGWRCTLCGGIVP